MYYVVNIVVQTMTDLGKPTSVRLERDLGDKLHRVARKHRVRPAVLIRDAIASKIADWEANGVRLTSRPEASATAK